MDAEDVPVGPRRVVNLNWGIYGLPGVCMYGYEGSSRVGTVPYIAYACWASLPFVDKHSRPPSIPVLMPAFPLGVDAAPMPSLQAEEVEEEEEARSRDVSPPKEATFKEVGGAAAVGATAGK